MALRRGSQGFGFDPCLIRPGRDGGLLLRLKSLTKGNNDCYLHGESSENPDCRK